MATHQNLKMNPANQRSHLLKSLKDQRIQKISRNLTLDHIKETFQSTDWNQQNAKSKKKIKAVGADGKEVELHDGDSEDSEYLGEEDGDGGKTEKENENEKEDAK